MIRGSARSSQARGRACRRVPRSSKNHLPGPRGHRRRRRRPRGTSRRIFASDQERTRAPAARSVGNLLRHPPARQPCARGRHVLPFGTAEAGAAGAGTSEIAARRRRGATADEAQGSEPHSRARRARLVRGRSPPLPISKEPLQRNEHTPRRRGVPLRDQPREPRRLCHWPFTPA